MVSIASDLMIKPILDKLMNATIEKSRYICCFTCITEDFEKEMKNLKTKKTTLEELVKKAYERTEHMDVILWQKQVDDLIEEDTKTKVTCFFGWCPNCKWQYSRGKELESRTKEIKRLMERNFENVEITRHISDIEYHSSQNYISFKSRKSKYEELLNACKDDNNYMIGLQGMGGTGKTTLAREMGKELKKSNIFDKVIDTTVSNTPDTKKIQDDIAGPLGLSLKDCTESERPRILWNRLMNGEKILVILDDVWGDISFDEIGIPFKDNHKGCRILVTTREMSICKKMECDKIIQLHILPEEDGWILFQKHAGLNDSFSKSVIDKGRKICKECKGLPIAIAVIASSLKGQQRPEEWDVALQSLKSLQKSMPLHGDDENWSKVYKCLMFSYDNMKNKTAKELFLLCSIFREDEEFDEETLVTLAVGAGLIEKIDNDYSYNECRNEVVVAKNKLIDSCLLLKGEYGRVKMHDLVREVALSIANKEILEVNTSNKKKMSLLEKTRNIKYLLCEGKGTDLFSFKFDGSKLNILIVYFNENDYVEVPKSFFQNIMGLKVFYLKPMRMRDPQPTLFLPQSIQWLTDLRSLYLQGVKLGDISFLGMLQGLENLELVRCEINDLPKEIAKLVKFKLLSLYFCRFKRNNSFEVIESCTLLEELYYIDRFSNDISIMPHNVKLPKYQRFSICDFKYLTNFSKSEWLRRNYLIVFMADYFFSEVTFKNLVRKTEFLYLNRLEGRWKNLIPEIILPEDECRNNLVEIDLRSISQLRCLIDNTDSRVRNVLSKLVALYLHEMENLKEICSGPLPFEFLKSLENFKISHCIHLKGKLFKSKISLCNLKWLRIQDCPMLTSLFNSSTAQSLVSLKILCVYRCKQLKNIIIEGGEKEKEIVDGDKDNKSGGSLFPNLTELLIRECPQLHFILPVATARDVRKLEVMEISDCIELNYIFGRYQYEHEEEDLHQELEDVTFTSLKRVELSDLPNLVDIFPEFDHSMCSSVKRSSSKDVSKAETESKDSKCKILHWIHKYRNKSKITKISLDSKDQLQDSSLSLVDDSNEKEVAVRFKNIALSDTSQKTVGSMIYLTLQNVTVLVIEQCEKMEVMFSASMSECLPYLQSLGIFECNELKQIIVEDTKNQGKPFFPRLKLLFIRGCNKLKCVFPISSSKMLPKLEVLAIKGSSMLEEVFEGESNENVEIPNLKAVIFVELPSLCLGIEFLNVVCFVKNCPKLSVSSSSLLSLQSFKDTLFRMSDKYLRAELRATVADILEDAEAEESRNENGTTESSEVSATETEDEATSGSELVNAVKQSKETTVEEEQHIPLQTHSLEIDEGKIDIHMESASTKNVSDGDYLSTNASGSEVTNQYKKKILQERVDDEDSKAQEISNENEMEKDTEDFPIGNKAQVVSGTEFTSSQEIKTSVEEGIASARGKKISSPIGLKSVRSTLATSEENGEGQIGIASSSILNMESASSKIVSDGDAQSTNAPESEVTNQCTKKILQERFDDEDSKVQEINNENETEKGTEEFPIATKAQVASGTEFTSSQGIKRNFEEGTTSKFENVCGMSEDSSCSSVMRRELEELVSNKHLASENMYLLADFLVKHPCVGLTDKKVSERYKGFAYTCLAELLKFLQNHTVLDVLGSSQFEFLELLQDVRRFCFDRDWLDGVERRAFFPGSLLCEDALQKLLHSKRSLIQDLDDVKHLLEESITEQEEQVLELKATLNTPLGY